MATITSNGTGGGDWGTAATWAGAAVPVDDDAVVIAAGDTVVMNVDTSAFANGINGLTITGHATTPGMLQFKSSGDGTYYLKMKVNTSIAGTSDVALFGRLMMGGGTWGSPAAPGAGRKQTIALAGTGAITGRYLAGQFKCDEPTNLYVETYKTAYGPVAQATKVDTANDFVDFGATVPADNTAVRVKSSDTLPTGLSADTVYFVYGRTTGDATNSKCKFARVSADAATVVDITAVGSGNITLYAGHTDTGTKTVNVIQDVTADTLWSTTAGQNRVVLADIGPADEDVQLDSLATINAGSLVITAANVDSAQYPCSRVYLTSRNVQILHSTTSTSQAIIDLTNYTATAGNGWTIACAIVPTDASGANRRCCGINAGTSVPGTAIVEVTGGTISGCTYGVIYGTSHTISGGTISGCTYGVNSGTSYAISGGTISGCTYGVNSGTSHAISGGTISGCTNGVYTGNAVIYTGATFASNTYDIRRPRNIVGYGVTPTSTTQAYEYKHAAEALTTQRAGCTIYDYLDTPGYIGRWDVGGYTVSTAYVEGTHGTPAVTPPTCIHVTTAEDNDVEHWVDIPIWGAKAQDVTVKVYVKQVVASSFDTRPTFLLLDGTDESTLESSGEITDNTDWQAFELNSGALAGERPLLLRMKCRGGNAGGTGAIQAYWFQVLTLPAGGGGGPRVASMNGGLS